MDINGGANAIRGFNYQKAVISLIAILSFDKDEFRIFVENKEDAEVFLSNKHIFIQIKSSKLSINKLTKSKSGKQSILGKNLCKTDSNIRYKIVTPEYFAQTDKKEPGYAVD